MKESATVSAAVKSKSKSSRMKNFQAFLQNPKARIGFIIFSIFAIMAIFAPIVAPYNPNATLFSPLSPPSWRHWLGTTGTGQDVLSQFIWGARTSLMVGVGAGTLSTFIAVLVGMLPAYKGGWVDRLFDTVTNIFLIIPGLPLIIVISSYIHNSGPFVIILVIGCTGWAGGARVFRSQALTYVARDFVVAAKLAGASDLWILFREIMPNMLSLIVSSLMFGTLGGILAEAGLEFLGLGNVSVVSWGTMLYWSDAGGALLLGAWWWLVPGGLGIALFGMSLALMNFGIDQVTNPRLRDSRPVKQKNAAVKGEVVHG